MAAMALVFGGIFDHSIDPARLRVSQGSCRSHPENMAKDLLFDRCD